MLTHSLTMDLATFTFFIKLIHHQHHRHVVYFGSKLEWSVAGQRYNSNWFIDSSQCVLPDWMTKGLDSHRNCNELTVPILCSDYSEQCVISCWHTTLMASIMKFLNYIKTLKHCTARQWLCYFGASIPCTSRPLDTADEP